MRRFCGIYVLYVKFDSQKTYFFGFGYWRPRVRVPPLRPKDRQFDGLFILSKKGEDENLPRASDGVRIPNEAIERLAFQRRIQEYSPLAKIPPLRPFLAVFCKEFAKKEVCHAFADRPLKSIRLLGKKICFSPALRCERFL